MRHFDNDNENSRTLWTECFARNDLNGLYGTKHFENKTERFGDGTKRFENETKRFGNGTKSFENGTLLWCSSALQGLYKQEAHGPHRSFLEINNLENNYFFPKL